MTQQNGSKFITYFLIVIFSIAGTIVTTSRLFPYGEPALHIGDEAPDFTAKTQLGPLKFSEWSLGSWVVLMSHPKSFTPVCSTELAAAAIFQPEFERRHAKLLALSIDSAEDQKKWLADIDSMGPLPIGFPMVADFDKQVSSLYGMIDHESIDLQTVRSVFIIGPDRKIKLKLEYPATTGRSFPEILRALDALQKTAKKELVTPANWQPGSTLLIPAGADLTVARAKFGNQLKRKLDYLWTVENQ